MASSTTSPPRNPLHRGLKEIGDIARGKKGAHATLRRRLLEVAAVTILVDLLASVVVLLLERHATGTEITNYGDAFFWTSAQMLTVSSQMRNPVNTGGRIVDLFLELYAITVVATMAGMFSQFFHGRGEQQRQPSGA
jgi:hypothetical protein